MELSKQQTASQKNRSYIIAENLGQLILTSAYLPDSILPSELELSEQFQASRTCNKRSNKNISGKRNGIRHAPK